MTSKRCKNGEPLRTAKKIAEIRGRKDCIRWPFSMMPSGYGVLNYEGRVQNAHRIVHRLATGENKALDVAHSCGNRWCVNPDHLRWATRSQNMQDKVGHGTHARGEKSPRSKMSNKKARAIASDLGCLSHKDIAQKHGVKVWIVADISAGRTWSHITGIAAGRSPGE